MTAAPNENPSTQPHAPDPCPPKGVVRFNYTCNQCNHTRILQAGFATAIPLQPGCIAFPDDNHYICPDCGAVHNLAEIRKDLEIAALESIKKPLLP